VLVSVETSAGGHPDLALADSCRAGDTTAFEGLYRAHAPRLFGLICRLVGREEADDLLQDIFLSAHRKLASYRGESSLGTWLFRLATNVCIDHLRSRRAQLSRRSDPLPAPDAMPAGSQAGPILGVLSRLDLDRAIATLSPGCREVFVLHDVEGLEHREIAALLGISWGTSKSQLHQARRRLRATMAGTADRV
jgi:RNA polymerase sigma-70 factor (ECF subfamily)